MLRLKETKMKIINLFQNIFRNIQKLTFLDIIFCKQLGHLRHCGTFEKNENNKFIQIHFYIYTY